MGLFTFVKIGELVVASLLRQCAVPSIAGWCRCCRYEYGSRGDHSCPLWHEVFGYIVDNQCGSDVVCDADINVSHEEVLEVGKKRSADVVNLVKCIVKKIAGE